MVYRAFSEGMVFGVWNRVDLSGLGSVLRVGGMLLAGAGTYDRAQPLAWVLFLFPAVMAGLAMLPLILFHQLQPMVCATLGPPLRQSPPAPEPANRMRTLQEAR